MDPVETGSAQDREYNGRKQDGYGFLRKNVSGALLTALFGLVGVILYVVYGVAVNAQEKAAASVVKAVSVEQLVKSDVREIKVDVQEIQKSVKAIETAIAGLVTVTKVQANEIKHAEEDRDKLDRRVEKLER